ncbi:sugar ABC transporter substrate-binding protein, partial [Nonomuraea sp. NPDC055795]
GDQCMTVYKAVKKEADAAAKLAVALAKGEKPTASGTVKDSQTGADVPAELLDPQPITFDTVKDVVADGYVTKDELCTGDFAAKCTEAGIS